MKSLSSIVHLLLFIHLVCRGLLAQTIISTDTIWDTDQILSGDIIINSDATLTVKPGVTVQVVKVDQDQDGQGDIDIIVNGSLVAQGKPDSIIYFISFNDTVSSDYHEWGGINVNNNGTANLAYCHIASSDIGVVIADSGSAYIIESIIRQTNIGLELRGNEGIFISKSHIIDPDSIGILIHNGSHTNTTVLSSHVYSQTLKVNTSNVAGISILEGSPKIINTEVNGFYKAFNIESTSSSQLKNNYIHDNVFAATWLNGSTGTLEYSEISGNGTGPFIDDNSTPTINNNNLLDNAEIVGGDTIPTFGLWANNTNGYISNDWPVPGNAGLRFNVIGAHAGWVTNHYNHYVYVKMSGSDITLFTQYRYTQYGDYTDQWAAAQPDSADVIYVLYTSTQGASPYGLVPYVSVSGVARSHLLCANDGLTLNAESNWWGQVSGIDGLVYQKNAGTVSYSNIKTQAIHDAGLQDVGVITAVIKDVATGEVIPYVMITNAEHNLMLYSGADGTFSIPGLLADSYSLSYQKGGYNTRNITSVIPTLTDTLDLGVIYMSPTGSQLGPRLTGVSPVDGSRSADSLQTITIELYDEDGIDNNSVCISVNGVSYSLDSPALALIETTILFNIADLDSSFNEGTVSVSVDSVDDVNGYHLQNPYNSIFHVDYTPPQIMEISPTISASKSNQLVTVKITDEWGVIDSASIVFQVTINGVEQQYSISDAALTWNAVDSTLIFDPSAAGMPFADGDSVIISLQVSDHIDLGDANTLADGSYTWIFTVTILGDLSLQLHDYAENALESAKVSIARNGAAYREVSTDTTGSIELMLPTNSTYSVSCSKTGYFHYQISDISLNESTPVSLVVKLGQSGDYNADGAIDFYDVDAIVSAYQEQDASIEFGPVGYNDTIPNFNVLADGVFDFEDIMVFTLIWNHHEGLSEAALVAFAETPTKQATGMPRFLVSEKISSEEEASQVHYSIVIEDVVSLRSSRLVFKYDPTSLKFVSFQKTAQLNSTIPNELLVLSSADGENGYLELDMANLSAQAIASGDIFGHLIFEPMRENYGGITYVYDIIDDQYSVSQGKTEIISLPREFALHQNYPNPFNPNTTIRFELPKAGKVYLVVYDILGREVTRLKQEQLGAGYHQVLWDGRDQAGRDLSSGIYFAKLVTPEYSKTMKMLLLK